MSLYTLHKRHAGGRDVDDIIQPSDSPERKLFESIELELRKENAGLETTAGQDGLHAKVGGEEDLAEVDDKFRRLNLFFEKETVRQTAQSLRDLYSLKHESNIYYKYFHHPRGVTDHLRRCAVTTAVLARAARQNSGRQETRPRPASE